jgi:hypothetical protein
MSYATAIVAGDALLFRTWFFVNTCASMPVPVIVRRTATSANNTIRGAAAVPVIFKLPYGA